MKRVNMHEAKTNLSGLVRELRDGSEREVIICVAGKAAARLVPVETDGERHLGIDRGLVSIASDFDDVDPQIAALFERS